MSLLLALLIFAATAQQAEAPTTIVTRHWTQYSNWITKGDAESLANLYAPEARVMEPGLDDVIGRVAIRSLERTLRREPRRLRASRTIRQGRYRHPGIGFRKSLR